MDISNIPGLGFHPTNEELLTYYLKQRILNYLQDPTQSVHSHTVPDIDLYNVHPKHLPCYIKRLTSVKSNEREWVFFCAQKEKYHNISRFDRIVLDIEYWKITSKPKEVKGEAGGNVIGGKNILTFYEGCHPKGIKPNWTVHEYHLNGSFLHYNITEMPFVVCRLYCKGHKLNELTCEDDSAGRFTPETYADTCQHTPSHITSEPEIWKPLSPIQQLPNDLLYHNIGNFTGSRLNISTVMKWVRPLAGTPMAMPPIFIICPMATRAIINSTRVAGIHATFRKELRTEEENLTFGFNF